MGRARAADAYSLRVDRQRAEMSEPQVPRRQWQCRYIGCAPLVQRAGGCGHGSGGKRERICSVPTTTADAAAATVAWDEREAAEAAEAVTAPTAVATWLAAVLAASAVRTAAVAE